MPKQEKGESRAFEPKEYAHADYIHRAVIEALQTQTGYPLQKGELVGTLLDPKSYHLNKVKKGIACITRTDQTGKQIRKRVPLDTLFSVERATAIAIRLETADILNGVNQPTLRLMC